MSKSTRLRGRKAKIAGKRPVLGEAQGRELLAAHIQKDLSRLLPEELRGLEYLHHRKRNPLAAWHAYRLCRECELPLTEWPRWVFEYLDESAAKLIGVNLQSNRRKKKQAAVPVAKALGFVKPSKKNIYDQFKQELAELEMFIDMEREGAFGARGAQTSLIKSYARKKNVSEYTIKNRYYRWRQLLRGKQRISGAPLVI